MTSPERPRRVLRPESPEEDVDRELSAHLALCREELVAQGWDPEAAAAEARRRFGDPERTARECTDIARTRRKRMERGRMLEQIGQDLRYALRSLTRNPGFALLTILTLAVGIGANTVVFSLVNGIVFRPLPFQDPQELVVVVERMPHGNNQRVTWPNFRDWREGSVNLDALAAYGSWATTVLGGEEPVRAESAQVTEDFWRVLPTTPVEGRTTAPDDHREGAAPVAVLSQGLSRRLWGSESPVGRILEVNGNRAEVVGVVPADFEYPAGAELWYPAELSAPGGSRTSHNWRVVGRLRDGVTFEAADLEIDAMTQRLVATDPDAGSDYLAVGARVIPLKEVIVGPTREPLFLLLGASAFVLLVACANLASTFLARGTTRAREVAVRSALGAPRSRILRLFFSEASLLAVTGGAAGIGLASLAQGVIRTLAGDAIPRIEAVGLDGNNLIFTLFVTLLTAVAFGLLPSFWAWENAQARTLRSEGRGNVGRRGRIWGGLVMAEVALALVLLASSGLLIRSFSAILRQDPGIDASDVSLSSLALSGVKYPEEADHREAWNEILTAAEAIPGVAAAGVTTSLPLSGGGPNGQVQLNGSSSDLGDAAYVLANEGFFSAMDIPLLQGRLFGASDGPDDQQVAVVSRSFAERYWPGENPIGKLVSGGGMDNFWNADTPVFGTIIGVVGEVRYRDLIREGQPTVYWSYRQRPFRLQWGANLVVESASGDPSLVASSLKPTVQAVDPDVVVRPRLMTDLLRDSLAERRFLLLVLSAFAGVALLLAGVGIYGVVSYSVAQRARETGIRLALGANRAEVRRMMVSDAMKPVGIGMALGLAGTLALSRLMTGLLYGVRPTDPLTLAAVVTILAGTAWGASLIPAMRSSRVDPMVTMREEG